LKHVVGTALIVTALAACEPTPPATGPGANPFAPTGKIVKEDQTFVPAWNNLGVVLMERGQTGEAARVFQTAFALDSGNSDEIRKNLQRALAQIENPAYTQANNEAFDLVRRGNGRYQILSRR